MTQSRVNPNLVHSMDAEMHNQQMGLYAELTVLMDKYRKEFTQPKVWQKPAGFKLTQAAQFDGQKNSMIVHYALSAATQGYTYAEYVQFALAYSNTATLSKPEYEAMALRADLQAWRKALNYSNLGQEYDKHMIEAMVKGVSVIHVTTSETGDIVLKHLDASMLFNQRNHTV